MTIRLHAPTRRELLLGSGVLFAWAHVPKIARAEGRDPRVLVVVLRGALDGLAMVAPVGDPDWIGLRGESALVLDGKTPALPLDSYFALNPAMPNLRRTQINAEIRVVQAVRKRLLKRIWGLAPSRSRNHSRIITPDVHAACAAP